MALPFAEVRFETGYIIYGTAGGALFSTDVAELNSGAEIRNQNWQYGKGKWDFGDRKLPDTELRGIINFFRARKGRAQGFRFKDWGDFNDWGNGVLGLTGVGNGTAGPFQLVKNYPSGVDKDQRLIRKPVAGTIKLYRNGNLTSAGTYALDTTTGLVTFTSSFPTGSDVLTWTGEFDVPVRFDVDEISYRFDSAVMAQPGVVSKPYFYISSIPLVEVRS